MKVRIAAVIAVAVLAVLIGAWLWIGREGSQTVVMPAAGEKPPPTSPADAAITRPLESASASRPGSRVVPPPASAIAAATPVAPADGKLPPAPVSRMTGAPPSVPSAAPANVAPATTPPTIPNPEDSAKTALDLDQVNLMLRDYRTRMGENPWGTNAEIMKAVMGDNPKQARLGPPAGQTLNAKGELVDRWGTPIFFHQLSKTNMEIRSAGPDKVMWTDDDVIQR